MARHVYQGTAQDGTGRIIQSANITVYLDDGSTLATVYDAQSGGSAIANSVVQSDSNGWFEFWVDDSEYMPSQLFQVVLSKTGYTGQTWDDVKIIPDEPYFYYADATATNQGAATSRGDRSVFDLLATIGSNQATIKLSNSSGSATTDYDWGTNDTIPSNVFLDIEPGALIKPSAGVTLTVNSPEHIKASSKQKIVDLTNNSTTPLMFTNGGEVSPCWYGAVGDCTAVGSGTDDAGAFQAAANAVDSIVQCYFVTPYGMRFRLSSTVTFDWDGAYGGGVILNSPITPDAVVGNVIEFIDVQDAVFDLWVNGGGTLKDYTQADPADAEQCFLIRGVRDATINIYANSYSGRVCRATEEGAGEEKTSKLSFQTFHTESCGQSIYVDATSAFGTFNQAKWFWDSYGPYFYNTHDIHINSLDSGFQGTGMVIEGCLSFWADILSLGDETQTVDLLTIKETSGDLESANIHINAVFVNAAAKGVVLEDVGYELNHPSLTIDRIYSKNNGEHGLYVNNCRGITVGLDSVDDEVALEIAGGTTHKCTFDVKTLDTKKQAIIIGSGHYDLEFHGKINNANRDNAGGISSIDVNTTNTVEFLSFTIYENQADYAYDIVSSNNTVIEGGRVSATGSTSVMDNNPKVARNVKGFRTENYGQATISNGNPDVTVAHGLAVQPEFVVITGISDSTEMDDLVVHTVGATNFTIDRTSGSNVSADRLVYWYAGALLSQPD